MTTMSVREWAYDPKRCDGDHCPRDCDRCVKSLDIDCGCDESRNEDLLHAITYIMKRTVMVPNREHHGRWIYMPVHSTKHECYEALYQIQTLLGTNICTPWEKEVPPKRVKHREAADEE